MTKTLKILPLAAIAALSVLLVYGPQDVNLHWATAYQATGFAILFLAA